MRDPYRVMIFGPGGLGTVAIWETNRLPEFELVGLRAYSEEKNGKDAGELIGIGPVGVEATTDLEAALAVDCDCVLYTARDMGNGNTDDEIIALLEAGRNVVTPLPYHNVELFREAEYVEKLKAACASGGASFHATGMDPDLITDRVALALTGMCTDLKHMRIRETWPADGLDPMLLQIVGIGRQPEEVEGDPMSAGISTSVLRAIGRTAEHALGVTYEKVEEVHEYAPTPHDLEVGGKTVPKGAVARASHRFHGWLDADADHPFFTMEYNWYVGDALPEGVGVGDYWVVEIEGTPSARMVMDLRGSLEHEDRFYEIGKGRTDPGYHGTIAPCLQAVPFVVDAEPGVLPSFEPALHWKQDLRDLVG